VTVTAPADPTATPTPDSGDGGVLRRTRGRHMAALEPGLGLQALLPAAAGKVRPSVPLQWAADALSGEGACVRQIGLLAYAVSRSQSGSADAMQADLDAQLAGRLPKAWLKVEVTPGGRWSAGGLSGRGGCWVGRGVAGGEGASCGLCKPPRRVVVAGQGPHVHAHRPRWAPARLLRRLRPRQVS
jgi:hypothetical protein